MKDYIVNNDGNNLVIMEIIQKNIGDNLLTSIKFDRKIYEPFSPGSIFDITIGSIFTTFAKKICDLHHFTKYENNTYEFITYDCTIVNDFNVKNKNYIYVQWFTPDQLEYIKTKVNQWSLRQYKKNEDHEHCIVCWGKISTFAETLNKGYKFEVKNTWMCEECFNKYITNKYGEKLGP